MYIPQLVIIAKVQYPGRIARIVELLDVRVEQEVDALPNALKARLRRIVELIQGYSLEQMREPHVKHLEGRL